MQDRDIKKMIQNYLAAYGTRVSLFKLKRELVSGEITAEILIVALDDMLDSREIMHAPRSIAL